MPILSSLRLKVISMKKIVVVLLFLILTLYSCSHTSAPNNVSFSVASSGLLKNNLAPFPILLTDKVEPRIDLEAKYSSKELFIIHTGHLLNPTLKKEENENKLKSLEGKGIDLINLTLEDFITADSQGIRFEDYNQLFLNSSVVDLNTDTLATAKNILPYDVHGGMAFIGLSDNKIDKNLTKDKYIINDYVLSILKIKKIALQATAIKPVSSFIIIHTLGSEIDEVMERLPPSFINSMTDK